MPERSFSGRRLPPSTGKRDFPTWALRGLAAVGLSVVGAFSLSTTAANVIVRASPATALILAPYDGRVVAALAKEKFSIAPNSSANSEQARLAKRALMLDATAVDALNVLAMQADLRRELARVDRLYRYSFELSRRELQPQIWTIEKAAERGDIDGALAGYDLALRTSHRAQQTLFPVLASALNEPKVRAAVLRLLVTKPIWAPEFLDYASARGRNPQAVAELLHAGAGRIPIEEKYRVNVVKGLVNQGFTEQAWSFFSTFRPNMARDRSRDPRFELEVDTPSPFDWTLGTAPGLSASIVHEASGSYLEFSLPPSTPAIVATQLQVLLPGRYRLTGRSEALESRGSLPYWTLTCRAGGELGRVNVPDSNQTGGRFSGEFTVTPNCPVQSLSLAVGASDSSAGVFGQIKEVQLSRVKP